MALTTILFDLDNTLYPASSGVMAHMDTRITEFVQSRLGLGWDEATALRTTFLAEYGTTLNGLQQNYDIDAEDYLAFVHDLTLDRFLAADAEIDRLLAEIPLAKAIFTNSPIEHARRVLQVLGIEQHFSHVFDLRFLQFQPKPHPSSYRRALETLGATAAETVLLEDTPRNLTPARALGMTAILIDEASEQPAYAHADYVVPSVLAALRLVQQLV